MLFKWQRKNLLRPRFNPMNFQAFHKSPSQFFLYFNDPMITSDHLFEPSRPQKLANSKNNSTWRTSEAKKLLEQYLRDGTIPLSGREMGSQEVYRFHPSFAEYPYESFPKRLAKLRSEARTKTRSANSEIDALNQDRAHFPVQAESANGILRWEGSDAEALLKLDVANQLHEKMTPRELYHSREVYQLYKLKKFRGHIHQEVKRGKFIKSYYGK